MAKHVCSLYDLIRSNSDTNQQKNWKEVENRVKTQVPLRIMSCVQLASKLTSHYKVRGRPFDFWAGRGGGGMDDFRKKYPADRSSEKKILQGNNCHTMALYVGEKILSPEVWRKKFLTQTKSPTPPSKVKRSARKWTISFKWQQLHFIYISASSEGIWTILKDWMEAMRYWWRVIKHSAFPCPHGSDTCKLTLQNGKFKKMAHYLLSFLHS